MDNWDEDEQKSKHMYYEIEDQFFVNYYSEKDKSIHRKDSIFDLSKKNQFMEMEVVMADQMPHPQVVSDSMIWHYIIKYKTIGYYSFSGDCSKGKETEQDNNDNNQEYEQIFEEDVFAVSHV